MLNLRVLSLSLLMTTALTLGGCSDKNKTEVQSPIKSVKTTPLSKPGSIDFKALLAVPSRKTDMAMSESVLKALGLWEQTETLKWASRSEKNGRYTYTNLIQTGQKDDLPLIIDTLTLTGLHMVNGKGSFDRLDLDGLKVMQTDGQLSIKSAILSRPSPELASEILSVFEAYSKIEDLGDLDINIADNENFQLGAAHVKDLEITSDDNTVTLANLNYGQQEKTEKIFLEADKFLVNGKTDRDLPLLISLDKAVIHGLKPSPSTAQSPSKGDWAQNLSDGTFDQILFKNLDFNFDTLAMSSNGLHANSTRTGALTRVSQVLEPVTVKVSEGAKSLQIASLTNRLKELGYKTIVFKGQQTTEINEDTDTSRVFDSFFELEDGFTVKFDYNLSGIDALKALMNSGVDTRQTSEDILDRAKIISGSVSLTDTSILDRILTLIAKKQNTSKGVLKMQAKSALMIASFGAKSKEDGKIITNIAGAIGNFIDEGGRLDIALTPKTPLAIGAMQGLQTGEMPLSELGLTVNHYKP